MKTQKEIREELKFKEGGTVSHYLRNLISAGFVSEHYQWSLKAGKPGKQKLYRLSDPFTHFHLKYVEPFAELIRKGTFLKVEKGRLPGWDTIMGFQLETLLLSNRELLFKALGIDPEIVICDNPYFQNPTTRNKGLQIDYLVQTKINSAIICEFKFRKNELNSSIIKEMKEKSSALLLPKGFGKSIALFHLGGVSPKVEESGAFYRLVDLRDLLTTSGED